jgi:hypothetical protein
MKNIEDPSRSLHKQHLFKEQKLSSKGDVTKGTRGCFFVICF